MRPRNRIDVDHTRDQPTNGYTDFPPGKDSLAAFKKSFEGVEQNSRVGGAPR